MKFIKKQPPRKFSVGIEKSITLKDCGKMSQMIMNKLLY